MNERFDHLSRTLAGSTSRRGALKMIGGALVGAAAATVLRPAQAHAVCAAGESVCGPNCCPAGVACINPTAGTCGCPPGRAACGTHCCPNKGDFCAFTTPGGCDACCPKGTTPCGRFCCNAGSACLDRSRGTCGCPPNTRVCGTDNPSCCPPDAPCPTDLSTCTNAGNLNHCLP
ncbi:MAG: hypothetical protein JWP02_3812 [Acidimicrobiales bacterium]|nr:hypothetical protein [Acidimicrobiales bacterium]